MSAVSVAVMLECVLSVSSVRRKVIGCERAVWLCFVTCVATHASDNFFYDKGATALASKLHSNRTLQRLDIASK